MIRSRLSCYGKISIDFTIGQKIISQLCEVLYSGSTSGRDVDPGPGGGRSLVDETQSCEAGRVLLGL